MWKRSISSIKTPLPNSLWPSGPKIKSLLKKSLMKSLKGTKAGCFMNSNHIQNFIQDNVSSLILVAHKTNLKTKLLTPNQFNSAFMKRLEKCKTMKGKRLLRKTKSQRGAKKYTCQIISKIEQFHIKQPHNLW